MISFIVPAHNEEACLARTLPAIHEAARVVGHPYEVIVVDDASTDATAEVARENNARVVSVKHRQIAATRNAAKQNPSDPDAADFMFAAYQSKVDLLNTIADARVYNRSH